MKEKRPKKVGSTTLSPDDFLKMKLEGDVALDVGKQTLSLTNLHKVYWPREGITKGQLLQYYYRVSPYILPYLKNRALILKRYPDGIEKPAFHQHSLKEPPSFVRTFQRQLENGTTVIHPVCNNVATLLYLVNLGTISQHSWASRVTSPEKPDWIIFDLDPGEANFADVCTAALLLKEILGLVELECYTKTSGSSGLHIYLPIKPQYLYPQVVEFASLVASQAAAGLPLILTTERALKQRKGRIYLDYMQNGFGKSVATAYSARARPGAPVSTPVTWKEVQAGKLGPRDFTILNLFRRLENKGDLFLGTLAKRQSLARAMSRVGGSG
jgi:bifunctional non-homologous end joining protein LigD